MQWEYSERMNAYLYGTPNDGCGVFYYQQEWTGNIICRGYLEGIGGFDTKEEAMKYAVERLEIIRKELS